MAGVQGELSVEHSGADAEGLQEQAQAEARVDGINKQEHLLSHQAQPQQHQHVQQPVLPGTEVCRIIKYMDVWRFVQDFLQCFNVSVDKLIVRSMLSGKRQRLSGWTPVSDSAPQEEHMP